MLYKEMLEYELDVMFSDDRGSVNDGGGDGDGDGGVGDGGGVGGDAGDGGVSSPIANARCEFVIGNELGENRSVLYNTALADLYDDGKVNRLYLVDIKNYINDEFKGQEEAIKAAFKEVFPEGIGKRLYVDITDKDGTYFIEIPPNIPGFVRCTPPDRDMLVLATYVPKRYVGELIVGDVNPATTVFSTNVALKLSGDLRDVKESYLSDILGLQVFITQKQVDDTGSSVIFFMGSRFGG